MGDDPRQPARTHPRSLGRAAAQATAAMPDPRAEASVRLSSPARRRHLRRVRVCGVQAPDAVVLGERFGAVL